MSALPCSLSPSNANSRITNARNLARKPPSPRLCARPHTPTRACPHKYGCLRGHASCVPSGAPPKADADVVRTAVAQSGLALQFAAETLRADFEIVLTATLGASQAFEYADAELRADRKAVHNEIDNIYIHYIIHYS